jgi:hypothetical protein
MDSDLIKLVNKLQDTFANLGEDNCETEREKFALMVVYFKRW